MSKNYTVVIVGVGQLGRRHMQAMAKIDVPARLQLVDTHPDSLAEARRMLEATPQNNNLREVSFLDRIEMLENAPDFVIIATNSDARFAVGSEILETKHPRAILFEKFLFQVMEEYDQMEEMLRANGTAAWVNCPRRLFPYYQGLRSRFGTSRFVNYTFNGGEWGLASNAIHSLDDFSRFCGTTDIHLDGEGLDKKILESKRKGFIELTGVLKGRSSNGSDFTLESIGGSSQPPVLELAFEDVTIRIDESKGKAVIEQTGSGASVEETFRNPYQSELTHLLSREIFETGRCALPSFRESAALHKIILSTYLSHLNKAADTTFDRCPIT